MMNFYFTFPKSNVRKIAFLMLSVLLLNSYSVQAKSKNNKIVTVYIKTQIICDHCKACETCGKLFDEKMFLIKGIKSVDVNSKENTIKVVFNSKKVTLQQIKESISKLGYDADDLKADPNGYEKLDSCCKPN